MFLLIGVIVTTVLAGVVLAVLFGVAIGRASARADERTDEQLATAPMLWSVAVRAARQRAARPAPQLRAARLPCPVSYAGTAGLAFAHETISREPSIALPSPRMSVGTIRLPVSRRTPPTATGMRLRSSR